MISYHVSPAERQAMASRADAHMAAHAEGVAEADRAEKTTGKLRHVWETPDEFLRRIGYKK